MQELSALLRSICSRCLATKPLHIDFSGFLDYTFFFFVCVLSPLQYQRFTATLIDIKNILFVFQVFSFFNVIRFRNVQCTGVNGQYGTCYSRQECTRLGGIASGGCARNWGTCCVSKLTGISKCASASVCDHVGVGEGTGRLNNFCGHKQCIECRVFFITGTVY
jgi:hypothetical protein